MKYVVSEEKRLPDELEEIKNAYSIFFDILNRSDPEIFEDLWELVDRFGVLGFVDRLLNAGSQSTGPEVAIEESEAVGKDETSS